MRISVFASYNEKGNVHEYVLSYLKYLREVSDKIIFIADNEASKSEQVKLNGLVDYASFKRHGEFDFGSYKRGYEYAQKMGWLKQADEIVFCNDSCFCVCSLKPVFEKMAPKKCDFWAMTTSREVHPHLQSFFMVFKKRVLISCVFKKFISSIQRQSCLKDVVSKYEIPLKMLLNNAGFKDTICFESSYKLNPTIYDNIGLLKEGYPLLKKKVFTHLENAKESRRKILKTIKQIDLLSYQDICHYYRTSGCCCYPWIMTTDIKHLLRFLYQKKKTKSGRLIIKICKILVYRGRI